MTNSELLDSYWDGKQKYQNIIGRMNLELPWGNFGNKAGIIKQLEQSDYPDTTVFYMRKRDDGQFEILKEKFVKKQTDG